MLPGNVQERSRDADPRPLRREARRAAALHAGRRGAARPRRYPRPPRDPPLRAEPGAGALAADRARRAQSAPSKSDLQQYAIIVLQDPEKIARIADWIGGMDWIKQAPVFLLFCGDVRRARAPLRAARPHACQRQCRYLHQRHGRCGARPRLHRDGGGCSGLGTCPISYVRNHVEKIGPLCSLPPGVYPVAGLTLGVPAGPAKLALAAPAAASGRTPGNLRRQRAGDGAARL